MRLKVPDLAVAAIAATVVIGLAMYLSASRGNRSIPENITAANGRIEVERVDVASKSAGRIDSILVREGDLVTKGQVVARLDDAAMLAQLAAAKASVERAIQSVAKAEAETASRAAELELAQLELTRAAELRERAVASQSEMDRRHAQRDVASAAVQAAKAGVADARAAVNVARAEVAQIDAMLADMTLKAPVSGRVEYRMVQPGEVVPAGGRVVTLLDLSNVFMTIFVPTKAVGRIRLGTPARIILDAASDYVVPASVSFVAAEAQFTPKTVETRAEREKLMYRVKVQVPLDLLERYRDYVKAGLTGNAYVALGEGVDWPVWLQPRVPDAGRSDAGRSNAGR